ncbi:predicted protein [Sclerotinia sclerotiorum 1980 UF-70]|uniref:Uncharacterized protein n=1 Tax=Sclerotinia sclerotiorum (strain ATCC 18683 / 1980 / Ss-1) TaxID=665079 RepID=A7EKC6_SCLS1|nr:predicted protein [Sclerotinia sclerotiorum 1980 UF-70]EDO03292.1 predicted protein [Sclerotinia sclerotiorum 1980 UF-70]
MHVCLLICRAFKRTYETNSIAVFASRGPKTHCRTERIHFWAEDPERKGVEGKTRLIVIDDREHP